MNWGFACSRGKRLIFVERVTGTVAACGCSAVGSASPCQGEGREFKSRHPLGLHFRVKISARLAQRESASLTRKRSLVQSQYRARIFVHNLMIYADVAQLVAHHLAKVRVASSSLVIRSEGLAGCRPRRNSLVGCVLGTLNKLECSCSSGGMAEWLGNGLQNRAHGFDSRSHLSYFDACR